MSRVAKIALVIASVVFAVVLLLPVVNWHRRVPAELFVHLDSLPWQTVTVESTNLSRPMRYEKGQGEIRLAGIQHGVYRIVIRLEGGQVMVCELLHSNAGVRRRVDVTVTASGAGYHFRETANGSQVLFEGEARAEEATGQKPFRLDWI